MNDIGNLISLTHIPICYVPNMTLQKQDLHVTMKVVNP